MKVSIRFEWKKKAIINKNVKTDRTQEWKQNTAEQTNNYWIYIGTDYLDFREGQHDWLLPMLCWIVRFITE